MRFDPYFYKFELIHVQDADTIYGYLDQGLGHKQYVKLRFAAINAPETRGLQRIEGLRSRQFLLTLLTSQNITIRTVPKLSGKYKGEEKKGKYGRYLAYVFIDAIEISLNQYLVEQGYAEYKSY